MATSEELFISIYPKSYRQSKSCLLMSQVELLHSLKHFQNLKVLSRQKNDLKQRLQQLLSSTLSQIEVLQSKMPTPKIPKAIQKSTNSKSITKIKSRPAKRDAIEEELLQIQEKLQSLNAAA